MRVEQAAAQVPAPKQLPALRQRTPAQLAHKAAYMADYHRPTPRDPEQRRAYNRAHYRANREQYKARQAAWHDANPGYSSAAMNLRRARVAEVGGSYTPQEWEALKAHFNYRCLMCGQQEPTIKLTVDHVVPIVRGGANSLDNLQPLCKSCNDRKHDKVLDLRGMQDVA